MFMVQQLILRLVSDGLTFFFFLMQSDDSFHGSPVVFEGRVINYEVFDDNGNVDEAIGERTFTFKGSGVEELKQMLKEEAGVSEDVCICSRNPLNGKLYRLRLHLPPNNTAMHVIVVPLSSKGYFYYVTGFIEFDFEF